MQGQGRRERSEWSEIRHAGTLPHQFGGKVHQKFVDQTFANQRTIEFVAGFDVQFIDFPKAQVLKQGSQIDFSSGCAVCVVAGQMDYGGTSSFQCCSLVGIVNSPVNKNFAYRLKQRRVQGRLQFAIHNNQVRLGRGLSCRTSL